ncbi:lysozyme [Photobacterium damselae]|uniref:lysozyme n=1 Tax=Photobacterium damselae TaxID=38293 RepID=UPI001F279035|nr:lysozyme [Photobacterium damselae]UKA11723.1 lysozyme [Photobacterium damselae subsp. damselae]
MRYNKLTAKLLACAIALTGGFEGYRHYAYQDSGGVWTACFGETKRIHPGDQFTISECETMLTTSLDKHNAPIRKIPQQLPLSVHLAALDMSYNIGASAFERSTMYRYLLNGDYPKACRQISHWRFVSGKDCAIKRNNCYGIVKRRELVQKLCLGKITINDALIQIGQEPLAEDILRQMDAD